MISKIVQQYFYLSFFIQFVTGDTNRFSSKFAKFVKIFRFCKFLPAILQQTAWEGLLYCIVRKKIRHIHRAQVFCTRIRGYQEKERERGEKTVYSKVSQDDIVKTVHAAQPWWDRVGGIEIISLFKGIVTRFWWAANDFGEYNRGS